MLTCTVVAEALLPPVPLHIALAKAKAQETNLYSYTQKNGLNGC
jgi:hypothetical protein